MPDLQEWRKRKRERHDRMRELEEQLSDLRKRRQRGEEGLTPRIRDLEERREITEKAWREAVKHVEDKKPLRIKHTAGAPHWGGAEDVIEALLVPVLQNAGVPITSRKRSACFGNCSSDHHFSQVLASAIDAGTANNYKLRDECARALGIEGPIRDYAFYYFVVDGIRFRVQFIAGTHGTGPHLHAGVRQA